MAQINDLTTCGDLQNTTQIAQILQQRKQQGVIYTYIGNILLAVNPYQNLGIYSEQYRTVQKKKAIFSSSSPSKQYESKYSEEVQAPHIFAIANNAFLSMKTKGDQTVIVSGESGAGKTESSKFILKHLTRVSLGKSKDLQNKLIDSNPILEAFGNAKTTRNTNSSRFGKFSSVYFDDQEDIIGGKITFYLLEKTRVVFQPESERNFHAFYYLTKGAPAELKQKLYLVEAEENLFLNKHETSVSGWDDVEGYESVCKAFRVLGLTDKQLLLVWGLLGTILNLGNITFLDGPRQNTATISEMAWVTIVASQIGNDAQELERVLLKKRLQSGNRKSVYDVALSRQQAYVSRDALAKRIYEKLFNWVIALINEKLAPKKDVATTIS